MEVVMGESTIRYKLTTLFFTETRSTGICTRKFYSKLLIYCLRIAALLSDVGGKCPLVDHALD